MFFARAALTCVLFDATVYGITWQFSMQLSRPVFCLFLSQFTAIPLVELTYFVLFYSLAR